MSDVSNSPNPRPVVASPAPTGMPLLAAAGIALAFTGLVTSLIVTIVGMILAAVGFTGWFREVLPREHREEVPVAEPAEEILPERVAVTHLQVGEQGHRGRLPLEVHPYSAGIKGGIAGGFVIAALAVVHGIVLHGSPWYTINLLAAAGMASLATASAATLAAFSLKAFLVALMIHAVASLLIGLLYGVLLPVVPSHPILVGGIVAPLLWSGLLWSSLNIIDPLLNERVEWGWFVLCQIAFGVTAGIVVARTEKIRTLQHLSFAVREGIEAPGLESEDSQ
jgi:cytochrome b subunit of formate dehydrogenase